MRKALTTRIWKMRKQKENQKTTQKQNTDKNNSNNNNTRNHKTNKTNSTKPTYSLSPCAGIRWDWGPLPMYRLTSHGIDLSQWEKLLHINGQVQNSSNSSALAIILLQSCSKQWTCNIFFHWLRPGGRFNIKILSYWHSNYLYKDETVSRLSHLYKGNPWMGKTATLY